MYRAIVERINFFIQYFICCKSVPLCILIECCIYSITHIRQKLFLFTIQHLVDRNIFVLKLGKLGGIKEVSDQLVDSKWYCINRLLFCFK